MVSAAEKPISDQRNGIARITFGTFLTVQSRMPNVKIVVGQGSPNVGELGYA